MEASAETVRRRVGRWAEVHPRTPDRCTLVMETDSLDGPLFALGTIGAPFTVTRPPELAALADEWGHRFVGAGGGRA